MLVATDGRHRAFGYDGRRLRPNIGVGGVEGLAERDWPGKALPSPSHHRDFKICAADAS